jgi:hypothetical protein
MVYITDKKCVKHLMVCSVDSYVEDFEQLSTFILIYEMTLSITQTL